MCPGYPSKLSEFPHTRRFEELMLLDMVHGSGLPLMYGDPDSPRPWAFAVQCGLPAFLIFFPTQIDARGKSPQRLCIL